MNLGYTLRYSDDGGVARTHDRQNTFSPQDIRNILSEYGNNLTPADQTQPSVTRKMHAISTKHWGQLTKTFLARVWH